nr:hypothetical protein [Tanacetum cinerariifolium]
MVEKVVGDVGKWWSWAGMEERGGKTCGGKNGLSATVFAILNVGGMTLLQVWGLNT